MCASTSEQAASSKGGLPPLSRIGLNSNKAGMEGLDRDKINQVILQASKGSLYYQNEVRKDQEITRRVHHMLGVLKGLTADSKAAAIKAVDKKVKAMEMSCNLSRIIVHVDMDAFYAAIEMRDNPRLKDCPMAVGSNSMLSTSNYPARRFGVRAAMPGFIAKKLCPELVVVSPNFHKYHKASEQVKTVLTQYDPNFCSMGLDESYLDITDFVTRKLNCEGEEIQFPDSGLELTKSHWVCAEQVVQDIRMDVFRTTGLTASAGIATNKMLAKIASDTNKPNGQLLVEPSREGILKFVKELPIRKICGIGKVSEKMLNALDVTLCHHLYEKRDILSLLFSQTSSNFFLAISLGLGSVEVQRSGDRKSMSTERSFNVISDPTEHLAKCKELCQTLASDMARERIKARTVTVKMKTVGFEVKSRGLTLPAFICKCEELYHVASDLLHQEISACGPAPLRLRLMGIRISTLQSTESSGFNQETLTSFFKPSTSSEEVAALSECAAPTSNVEMTSEHSTSNVEMTSEHSTCLSLAAEQCTVSHTPKVEDLTTCPICGYQVSSENLILNQHIDECLNKPAIEEATGGLNAGEPCKLHKRDHETSSRQNKRKKFFT